MESEIAEKVLRSIIIDTRNQLTEYANSNNMTIDLSRIEDREIVRSIIKAVGFSDPSLEEIVFMEIFRLLDLQ